MGVLELHTSFIVSIPPLHFVALPSFNRVFQPKQTGRWIKKPFYWKPKTEHATTDNESKAHFIGKQKDRISQFRGFRHSYPSKYINLKPKKSKLQSKWLKLQAQFSFLNFLCLLNRQFPGSFVLFLPKPHFLLLVKKCLGYQITKQIHKLHWIFSWNRIGDLLKRVQRHTRIHHRNNRYLQPRRLLNHRRLPFGIQNHDTVRRLTRAENDLLVSGPKLLGTRTVGEKAAEPPGGVGGEASDFSGHLLDDFVEEGVGVDKEETTLLADEWGHEVAGISHADEGLVGVDDGAPVAEAIGVDLEMVLHQAPPHMGVGAQKLLYNERMYRHFLRSGLLLLQFRSIIGFSPKYRMPRRDRDISSICKFWAHSSRV